MMVQNHSVEAQMMTSRIDDTVQILQPPPSVIFQRVDILYTTLNFGHVRMTANLAELQEVAHRIGSTTRMFKGLTNYTDPGILRNINPQAANAFAEAERGMNTRGKYPSKTFSPFMKAMVNT